jgi:lipocalin-like protein
VPTKPTNSLTGLWELVSVDVEYQDTDETKQPYGTRPNGYLVLLPEGRMMALITAEGRKEPLTEEERSAALRSMLAYSGIYRFEDDKWITRVDVAWNEAWTGSEPNPLLQF